jgi:hypothetical protein
MIFTVGEDTVRGVAEPPACVAPRPRVETTIRWAIGIALVFQVAQRFAKTGYELSEYGRSLWYVTYQHGFVRRGLAGEVLRTVLGDVPSLGFVDFAQNAIAIGMLGAITALVVLLCRLRTVIGYATAALVVAAPFCFDAVGGQRRPDLFGYLLLAILGIWAATRRVHAVTSGLVGGVLLGVSALVSEACPLVVGPWLVLVVVAAGRAHGSVRSEPWLPIACCAVPSAVTLTLLAVAGRASNDTVVALENVAPWQARGHGSVFGYLTDTLASSFERVVHGPGNPVLSVLVGGVLVTVCLFCARGCAPYVGAVFDWILPTRRLRTAWTLTAVAAAVVLFALGFDWLRWIASIGFAALLAGGAIVVLDGGLSPARSPLDPAGRAVWHRPVPAEVSITLPGLLTGAAAVYLVVLAPLPNFVKNAGDAAQTLLSVPR